MTFTSLLQRALSRLHYLPIILVSTYVLFIALILHPQIQAHNVFLHSINFPFHLDLSKPEKIKSLPAGKVRNFQITSIDGIKISGWHLLPNSVERSGQDDDFDQALKERGTLIYFHGNAMNRAAPFRIQAYSQFTALDVNVVAIDYRGFGDSAGSPSEEGLQRDARATYRWIKERQKEQQGMNSSDIELPDVYIAGQSLGTGVAARLALDLIRVEQSPKGLFLIAPYTSIANLLTSYKIGGFIPLFWPLGLWKVLSDLTDRHLYTRFESHKALYQIVKGGPSSLSQDESERYGDLEYTLSRDALLQELGQIPSSSDKKNTKPPNIIISHADDDAVIPNSHGRSLLDTISVALGHTPESITGVDYHWGKTLSLQDKTNERTYVLIKSRQGGHNGVPQHAVKIFSSLVGLD